MVRQNIVFFTGAGIGAESGLETYRGKDGLWNFEEQQYLASADCLYNNTEKCLDFFNERRKRVSEAKSNDAHHLIAGLEKEHNVTVITQNVDNLHERAGSSNVIHLHGELSKVCSMGNRITCVKEYPLEIPIKVGDKADDGTQLRPYVVLFGEYVTDTSIAVKHLKAADILVVIGTSLQVNTTSGLINHAHHLIPKFLIDPNDVEQCNGFIHFKTTATLGMKMFMDALNELL